MAYQVVWSPKALEDVDAIAAYIFRDSASYAAAVIEKIIEATSKLTSFPLSGSIVPEYEQDTIREMSAFSYRIIYRIGENTVTIATVIQANKLLEKFQMD